MIELKPCPFCGGKAELQTAWDRNWANYSRYTIMCQNRDCGARIVEMINDYEPEHEKIVSEFCKRWNRRAEE